jgi:hypothetical protein
MRTLPNLFVLETNVFNFALGAIHSQHGEENLLHPIDFCSSNYFPVEINYKIHDNELLAIVDAFERVVSFVQRSSTQNHCVFGP